MESHIKSEQPYQRPLNAVTVDVEDYYQVSAFEKIIDRKDWSLYESRVERNTFRCLELFSDYEITATFFILGIVAEKYPQLVRAIAGQGHEIASHGYSHVRVMHQSPQGFFEDVSRTKTILEEITGESVKGYRAASYSISSSTPWAYDALLDAGYLYSSSKYPISHDLYGDPQGERFPHAVADGGLTEIPISTCQIMGRNLPIGGGGYFRLLPYPYTKLLLNKINSIGVSGVFYFHPWEIDPDQPVVKSVPIKTKIRHYSNLSLMLPKLQKLMKEFHWTRLDKLVDLERHKFVTREKSFE